MFLWWGPELIQIYNDAYIGLIGDKVMTTGESTWHEDQYLPIERNGRLEDVWWTYSYSPVYDEEGRIAATLVVCQETTTRVIGQREREQLLREVGCASSRTLDFRQGLVVRERAG